MQQLDISELPLEAVQYIAQLRKESSQYRTQRNKAREEVGSLRLTVGNMRQQAEVQRDKLAAAEAELADLKSQSR